MCLSDYQVVKIFKETPKSRNNIFAQKNFWNDFVGNICEIIYYKCHSAYSSCQYLKKKRIKNPLFLTILKGCKKYNSLEETIRR